MAKTETFQTITLDLDLIKVEDKWNARSIGDKDAYASEVKRLARSIKEHGQDNPVLVRQDKDGRYFLIAGFRRYHAIKDVLGGKTIRATIRESKGDLDDLIANVRENLERKSLSTYDLAARCHLLKKEYRMDSAAIASALAGGFNGGGEGAGKMVSTNHIDRLVSYFAKLHPSILDGWRDGEKWATFNAITQSGIASRRPDEQADWAKEQISGKKPGKKGEKKGKPEGKPTRRASPALLEAALKACADSSAGESYLDGVVAALMFALGRRTRGKTYPMIPHVYDPMALKAAEKEAADKAKKEAADKAKKEAAAKKEADKADK